MQIWKSANIFVKTICPRFHIKTPFMFWDMHMWNMWKDFYKHSETLE